MQTAIYFTLLILLMAVIPLLSIVINIAALVRLCTMIVRITIPEQLELLMIAAVLFILPLFIKTVNVSWSEEKIYFTGAVTGLATGFLYLNGKMSKEKGLSKRAVVSHFLIFSISGIAAAIIYRHLLLMI